MNPTTSALAPIVGQKRPDDRAGSLVDEVRQAADHTEGQHEPQRGQLIGERLHPYASPATTASTASRAINM